MVKNVVGLAARLDYETPEKTFFSAEVKIDIGQQVFFTSCCRHSVKVAI